MKTQKIIAIITHIVSIIGFILCLWFMVWGWKKGIFSSQERLEEFMEPFGIWSYALFLLIQFVQVIFPIIPGGISCLAGVLLFGPVKGFILNYVGIVIGSIAAFYLARRYGRPLIETMFSPKIIHKYDSWTEPGKPFAKLLAFAIFFPVAPDDFLCYLAGTTKIKKSTFIWIIILGKPFSIALYSLGLDLIFKLMMH